MASNSIGSIVFAGVVLSVLAPLALPAGDKLSEDKYAQKVPNGPARQAFPATANLFPTARRWRRSIGPRKKLETFPSATVPGEQHDVDFMVKDSKRFADSGGWGYAVHARHDGGQAAAGERREMRVRVPHVGEVERLRFHQLRAPVIAAADPDATTAAQA